MSINNSSSNLDKKLINTFPEEVFRKGMLKSIKKKGNMPEYVIEYLMQKYCVSNNQRSINSLINKAKKYISDYFVFPGESEKNISRMYKNGKSTFIDIVSIKIDEKNKSYKAWLSNLNLFNIEIDSSYIKDFEKQLTMGGWSVFTLVLIEEGDMKTNNPFKLIHIEPIKNTSFNINEFLNQRKKFSKDEWIELLLRSVGIDPFPFEEKEKLYLLTRLIPYVESNYNLYELGSVNNGRMHIYNEISPYSNLITGNKATRARLFFNLKTGEIGLFGLSDVAIFDEIAYSPTANPELMMMLKDYMVSGAYSIGKERIIASASIIFMNNIDKINVDALIKDSHLFGLLPNTLAYEASFIDRFHFFIPGWEIPIFNPESYSNGYGLSFSYIAEYFHEIRNHSFSNEIDNHFIFGSNLNQRDIISIKKTVSGLIKLIYPDGHFNKEELEEILRFAMMGRRRIKEQLKVIASEEYSNVNFSYFDRETLSEKYLFLNEQVKELLIPKDIQEPGVVFTVGKSNAGKIGLFKIKAQVVPGSGKIAITGLSSKDETSKSIKDALKYFKSSNNKIHRHLTVKNHNLLINIKDLNKIGTTLQLTLAVYIAICLALLNMNSQKEMVIIGNMNANGALTNIDDLNNILLFCMNSGAKKLLLPLASLEDIKHISPEHISKFQLSFFESPERSVYKSIGVL